jgi:hypothetical protein
MLEGNSVGFSVQALASHVLSHWPMDETILVMPGQSQMDSSSLNVIAKEFEWSVVVAENLHEATAAQAHRKIVALLFHRDAFGPECLWTDAVRMIRCTLPDVRAVPCHGFSDAVDWPELCNAGAFHALWLPLKENEVRQSFGFVWNAEKQLANSAAGLPATDADRNLRAMQWMTSARFTRVRTRPIVSVA